MKTTDELIPLKLYSASNKLYIPVDPDNKRKNACIMLLSNDTEASLSMIDSSIIVNTNGLYRSYYTNKDVEAIINHEGTILSTDPLVEPEPIIKEDKPIIKVSEEVIYKDKTDLKFNYKSGNTNSIKEVSKVYNKGTVLELQRALNNEVNMDGKTIDVFIYNDPPTIKQKLNTYHGNLPINVIYIASPVGFDEDKRGPYESYLKHELAFVMINNINPGVNKYLAIYTAMCLADQVEYFKDNGYVDVNGAIVLDNIIKEYGSKKLIEIIKNDDISFVSKYAVKSLAHKASNLFKEDASYLDINTQLLMESNITADERSKLSDSEFGIPSLRKYPLHDEDHVRSAIRFFNHVDSEHEKELAENIKKSIKKFKMDIAIGKDNRLNKYM